MFTKGEPCGHFLQCKRESYAENDRQEKRKKEEEEEGKEEGGKKYGKISRHVLGITLLPVQPGFVSCCFHQPRRGAGHQRNLLRQSTWQPPELAATGQVVSAAPGCGVQGRHPGTA